MFYLTNGACGFPERVNLEGNPNFGRLLFPRAGMSETSLAMIGNDSIKDELRVNTDEAIARGAFGAPTFFIGDEMFFGNDRFEFIREAID